MALLLVGGGCRTPPKPAPEAPLPPGRVVVVQPGQTLNEVARASGVSVEEIVEVNGLRSADEVSAGQTLFLPEPAAPPLQVRPMPAPPPTTVPTTVPTTPTPPTRPVLESATVLAWPVDGVVLRDFLPPGDKKGPYDGLLLAAPADTPVRCARAGVVAFAGTQGTRLGTLVVVDHGDDLVTVYGHLGALRVKAGERLKAGDTVGVVGTSGLIGVSPRLYFEARKARVPVDPLSLLPP